ncbi:MAG: hypothetical protein QGG58_10060 [Chloroflexota bacterium]|jgi:hypothetical protein|nr:hypothetical protein [Chloroflexota bacterium]
MDPGESRMLTDRVAVRLEVIDGEDHLSLEGTVVGTNDAALVIDVPSFARIPNEICVGAVAVVTAETDGVGYRGHGEVLQLGGAGERLVMMSRPVVVAELKRREAFRIGVAIPDARLVIIPAPNQGERRTLPAEITDLSAGGTEIRIRAEIAASEDAPGANHRLEFRLDLNDPLGDRRSWENLWQGTQDPARKFSLPCAVLEVWAVAGEEGDVYGARCDFGDYPHEAEDWIYRFINQHESVSRLRERTREAGGTDQERV